MKNFQPVVVVFLIAGAARLQAAPEQVAETELQQYFISETSRLTTSSMADVHTWEDWLQRRDQARVQLREMLGLDPWPERGDLKATVTGRLEADGFAVEKLQFQSMPGLYVTGDLYVPKPSPGGPLPTILYLCGHARVVKDGVSFGNKTGYQHHGAWFARHGYVCLLIDTLQLGEIEGLHHGTYREGMWWWNSRGYTPAGVEAWNSIRALDYLSTRPEVDTNRFGVTGRSGGGAYSWWVTALDDRIRAAAPVAGITDLQNHVVDGVVEGHCDCMFIVNTYRWDYPMVAALAAPRPLLLVNTDHDSIFPLDGVLRVYGQLRGLYKLAAAEDRLGLVIGPGPHKDTENLQVPVFRWFNKHLKDDEAIIDQPALKFAEPEALRVFADIPSDQRNTTIEQDFVPKARPPEAPRHSGEWSAQRDHWKEQLLAKSFRAWPDMTEGLSAPAAAADQENDLATERVFHHDDVELIIRPVRSQAHVVLPLVLARSTRAQEVELNIVDDAGWAAAIGTLRVGFASAFPNPAAPPAGSGISASPDPSTSRADQEAFSRLRRQLDQGRTVAWFAPRGLGPDAWNVEAKKFIQIRRRFMLLGQTLDGMRVWDIRRALQSFSGSKTGIQIRARGDLACDALYASLFESNVAGLRLDELPVSHEQGPDYLNVLRFLDIPQAVAMAAERVPVELRHARPGDWVYPLRVVENLGWPRDRLRLE